MKRDAIDSCSPKYSTRDSKKDQHLQLNCSGSGVESTCTSRVIARRSDHGDFRVTKVNQVHSCQEAGGDEAEWEGIDSNRKQGGLDDEEQDHFEGTGDYDDCDVRVKQSRSDSEDEWKGSVAGSESEESTSTGSEDSDSSTSSDSSNTLKKAKGDRKKDEGKKSTASTRFPPARNLRNEIAELVVVSHLTLFLISTHQSDVLLLCSVQSVSPHRLNLSPSLLIDSSQLFTPLLSRTVSLSIAGKTTRQPYN